MMNVREQESQTLRGSDLLVLTEESPGPAAGRRPTNRTVGRSSAVAIAMGARGAVAAWGRPAAEMPIVDGIREVSYDEPPGEPDEVVAILRRLIGTERRARQHLRLSLPATWFEVGIIEVPPVGPVDAGELIERDLRRRSWLREGELVWKGVALGNIDGQAGYLVAAMPAARLDGLRKAASRAGLGLQLVVAPQLATLEVLRRFLGFDQPTEGAAALLHFHDSHVSLAMLHEGRPVQLRTLPYDTADLAGGVADGLIAELRRSALFFKQRSHGRTLETLFVTGIEGDRGEVLRDVLRDRLDLEPQEVVCPGVQWPDPQAVPAQKAVLVGLLQGCAAGPGTRIDLSSSRRRFVPAGLLLAVALFAVVALAGAAVLRVRLQSSAERGARLCDALQARCDKAAREAGALDTLRTDLTSLVGGWRTVEALQRADMKPAVLASQVLAGLEGEVVLEKLQVDQGLIGNREQLALLLQDEAELVSRCVLDGLAVGESYQAHSAIRRAVDRLAAMPRAKVTRSLDGADDWSAADGPVRFQLRATIGGEQR